MAHRTGRLVAGLAAAALAALLASPGTAAETALSIRAEEWTLADFHAQRAWELSTGAGVIVAVVDSGVEAGHPDLQGQVAPGVDFVDGPPHDGTLDVDGHGTGMASIIAGTGHGLGGRGMVGLAPGARILPVRVLGAGTPGERTGDAIRYAADHGARVINLSLGGSDPEPHSLRDMEDAVRHAIGRDAVVVASAGNSGDSGNPLDYPAAIPGVV